MGIEHENDLLLMKQKSSSSAKVAFGRSNGGVFGLKKTKTMEEKS